MKLLWLSCLQSATHWHWIAAGIGAWHTTKGGAPLNYPSFATQQQVQGFQGCNVIGQSFTVSQGSIQQLQVSRMTILQVSRVPRLQSSRLPGFWGSRVQGSKHQGSRLVRVLVWFMNNKKTPAPCKANTKHNRVASVCKGAKKKHSDPLQSVNSTASQGSKVQFVS